MNEEITIDETIKLEIPKELMVLNKIFEDNGFDLFIVGGFIRDAILNIETDDIDICASATPIELEAMLKDSIFTATLINKKLGTYKISTKGCKYSLEYTTFREENYDYGHCPSEVHFVKDVALDAKRRDFSVDAIYYNLRTKEFFDPFDGICACNERTLRVINENVFDCDGLRIMRLLRLAYTKNLRIDETTYKKARWKRYLLGEISHDRVVQEMRYIASYASSHYNEDRYNSGCNFFSTNQLLNAFVDMRLYEYIFPELENALDIESFYNHYIEIENLDDLLEYDFDIGLVYEIVITIEGGLGLEITPEFYMDLLYTKGLMLKRSNAERKWLIIDGLVTLEKMYDRSLFMNYVQLYFPMLIDIRHCRYLLTKGVNDEVYHRLETTNKLMCANNIPRNLRELELTAIDIMDAWPNLSRDSIGKLLECALIIATKSGRNEKDFLLEEIEKMLNAQQGEEKND